MKASSKLIKLNVFNVKLLSDDRSGETAYRELFSELYKKDPRINTYGEKCTELRTMVGIDSSDIVYGTLLNYTVIDPDKWFDKTEDRRTRVELPEDKLPNYKIWEYFFIPSLHRFCILDKSGVSKVQVGAFLEKGLTQVLKKNEEIKVSIEVSSDAIERIINADEIRYLKINLSYSNNDLTYDYEKLIDDDMRVAKVEELEVEAKSRKKNSIDLEKSRLLKGYLRLSQSNGSAEATIVENKKTVKIETKDHPLRLNVEVSDENILKSVLEKMRSIFKRNNVKGKEKKK